MTVNIKKNTEKIRYYAPPKKIHTNISEAILPESKLDKVFRSKNQLTEGIGNRGTC